MTLDLDEELPSKLDAMARDSVRSLLTAVVILYVIAGTATVLFGELSGRGKPIMTGVTFGTAVFVALVRLGLQGRTLDPRWANPIIACPLTLMSLTAVIRLHFSGDPMVAAFTIDIAMLCAALLLRRRWLIVMIVGSWICWAGIIPTISWSVAWTRATAAVVMVPGIALLVQNIRVRRVARDLAIRRELQEALDKTRDAELAERRAREDAEAASRDKSQFLAHISHEIRTPMNAVIGMTRLLLDSELSRDQREWAETVRDAGDGMLAIVNDLLDLAKIEAGRLVLDVIDLDVVAVVRGVAALLQDQARAKGIGLRTSLSDEIPRRLRGDPGRLRQLLLNLVGNAIKFTEEGEVVVRVDVASTETGRTTLRFEVRDTGIGIGPERQGEVFEPYVQARDAGQPSSGGTGLGLAIVRHLVQQMGGEIGVDSEVGVGSTFWFTLPIERGAAASESSAGRPPEVMTKAPTEGLEILVVDDNSINRRLVGIVLKRLGYRTVMVTDGREAVDAVREHACAAVLMDIQMPVLDGLEATREIRKAEATSGGRIPIIACTANALPEERERCIEAGMDGYLTKPIEPESLSRELARHVGAGGAEEVGVEQSTGP